MSVIKTRLNRLIRKIKGKHLIMVFILFYLNSALLLMMKKNLLAERVCNWAFGFLVIGIVLEILRGVKSEE